MSKGAFEKSENLENVDRGRRVVRGTSVDEGKQESRNQVKVKVDHKVPPLSSSKSKYSKILTLILSAL